MFRRQWVRIIALVSGIAIYILVMLSFDLPIKQDLAIRQFTVLSAVILLSVWALVSGLNKVLMILNKSLKPLLMLSFFLFGAQILLWLLLSIGSVPFPSKVPYSIYVAVLCFLLVIWMAIWVIMDIEEYLRVRKADLDTKVYEIFRA